MVPSYTHSITRFVKHDQQGLYLTVPFTMPPNIASFTLSYHYKRQSSSPTALENGRFTSQQEVNIIDLGLISPDGTQVGASGSNKTSITVSETGATPGYRACPLIPGKWQILLGAYKIAAEGVTITYDLTFTPKHSRLLKGDLHIHTLASDGALTVEELALHALRHGLDFLAITDHNQMVSADTLPHLPGLTLIPGIEWTHYRGHANFTGVDQPYDGTFAANTSQEVAARFTSARDRGALITLAHPFDEGCPFLFDVNTLPFDCIEVWNGPMRASNLRTIEWWHGLLAAGRKIPACGGSDYHRSQLFIFPGGPTTCVYAFSPGMSDILSALRSGHAYIVYAPDGPTLELTAGQAMMGDSVPFADIKDVQVHVTGLHPGDELQMITVESRDVLLKAESSGEFRGIYTMKSPGFVRLEILRAFIPGMPMLPALVSNPIYFDPM